MRKLHKTAYFLMIVLAAAVFAFSAQAQNPLKLDFAKTGGKFSDWVQKQYENYQSTMEQISESQFATFIGDGIKAAKSGIQFAQDKYNEAMKLYQDTKDAVVNSTEYKAAMLSKQIAEESQSLKNMQEEKKAKLEKVKADTELERLTIEEKITQAQENMRVSSEIYEQELQNAATEEEKDRINNELEMFTQGSEQEVKSFQDKISALEDSLQEQIKEIESEFEEQIYAQGEKIADLTMELQELLKEDKQSNGDTSATPEETIAQTMDDLSYKKGEAVSLKDRKNKEKKRRSIRNTALMNSSFSAVGNIASTDETKARQENISETSETVNGKSEAVQFSNQSTTDQLAGLQKYLELELQSIEVETVAILSAGSDEIEKPTAVIDICNYSGETTGIKGLLDKAKATKDNVESGVDKAKSVVNETKEKIEDGKQMLQDVEEVGKSIKDQSRGGMR